LCVSIYNCDATKWRDARKIIRKLKQIIFHLIISHKMEFVIDNYRLRATEEGKIERYYEYKTRPPFWKEIKGRKNKDEGYLQINLYLTSKRRRFLVHRLIYFAHNQEWDIYDEKQQIDHDDRDRTNNKIGNLKVVTHQQNNFNRGAKGYTYRERSGKYEARIKLDGKTEYLGSYKTAEEAREAYLDAKAKLHII